MDQQKRLTVVIILTFALTAVYSLWFAPKPQPPGPAQEVAAADAGTAAPAPVTAGAAAPTPPAPAVVPPTPSAAEAQLPPVREVSREESVVHLTFSSQGAGLTQAPLQGSKMREQPKVSIAEGFRRLAGVKGPEAPQMDMAVPIPGEPLPLSVGIAGAKPFPENARYQVEESPDGKRLTFTARQGNVELVKVFEWPRRGFDFAMSVTVKNLSTEPLSGDLAVRYARGVEPGSEVKGGYLSGVGNLSFATCSVGDEVQKKAPDEKPAPEFTGPINFFGVNQQYFLAALYPLEGPRQGKCVLEARASGRSVVSYFPLQVAAGQSVTQRFGVFIGPKDVELLRTAPERMKELGASSAVAATSGWSGINATTYPHLDKTVDFGMWAALCKVLLGILKFFFSVIHNWGVAIILLTVLVKVVLLPLTHKSMVSAEAMKKLQPRMEEIRKKFADDRERQNMEMMKLYQEAKVNPFGGCLPLLLQMPVWIALFNTLRNSYELYREPFISPLWADLTYKDPTYILPLLLGVTMIVTQKLQPQMMDAAQARLMTWIMPIFFTFIMVEYPAGLTLYIFTNNLLSIAQQYGLRRYLEKTGVATPREASGKKAGASTPRKSRT